MNCVLYYGKLPLIDAEILIWTESGDGTRLIHDWQGDSSDVNCIVGLTEQEVASYMALVKDRGDKITAVFKKQSEHECWDVVVKPIFLMEDMDTAELYMRYLSQLDEDDSATFTLHLQLTFNEPWGPVKMITNAYLNQLIESEAW